MLFVSNFTKTDLCQIKYDKIQTILWHFQSQENKKWNKTNYEKTLGIAWLIFESFQNNSIVLELEATAKDKNPTCQYQQYWPYTNNSLINAKFNPTRSSSD